MNHIFLYFKKGLGRIKENPQLGYTMLVAVAIFFAFLFTADRFVRIAQDAQERLINVRLGLLHDIFVEVVADNIEDNEYLTEKIRRISRDNKTIREFWIVRLENGQGRLIASLNEEALGSSFFFDHFLYNLALSDPYNSYITRESERGERFFRTARAVQDRDNEIVALIVTVETLSEADRLIAENIRRSLWALIFILTALLFLFFRHSKIVDYGKLYSRLKEVDQMKDDFIAMTSHELRTPLTAIKGYAELLKSAKLNKDSLDYVENIDKSASQLNLLIVDILDVSRIEQGRMEFNMEVFDPAEAVVEIIKNLAFVAKKKGLSLSLKKTSDSLIRADKKRFNQVMVNLIGNAVKYSEKGEITVQIYEELGKLMIRISDTGIGMTHEEQSRLFEKFYRVKSQKTADIRGTGLGLWISKRIVENMNGKISVESIKDVGTHFIVTFPSIENKKGKNEKSKGD